MLWLNRFDTKRGSLGSGGHDLMEYYAQVGGGGGGAAAAAGGLAEVSSDPSLVSAEEWQQHHLQHALVRGDSSTLQEAVWQIDLQSPDEEEPLNPFPERPGEPDCVYYMRTGMCSFGISCRYNHPPNWKLAAAIARSKGEYPERPGQAECQYFLKTGSCKFGATCKYHHPREKAGGLAGRVQLNMVGLPLRQGEKECAYYMRTGACKYGVACKFHHPQPAPLSSPLMPGSPLYGAASPSPAQPYPWPLARSTLPRLGPSGYVPMIIPPPQGIVSMPPGWTTYQGPVSPLASPDGHHLGTLLYSPHGDPALHPMGHHSVLQASPLKDSTLPERPGLPECHHYMKTGDCKFGAACRYHHPKDKLLTNGLPLRPGAPACTYYTRHGLCKFGSSCRFDHPLSSSITYSPSTSSLADMPVAPYPISMSSSSPSTNSAQVSTEVNRSSGEDSVQSSSEEITTGFTSTTVV